MIWEWLRTLDSHSVYDAGILHHLAVEGVKVTFQKKPDDTEPYLMATLEYENRETSMACASYEEINDSIRARGLGGEYVEAPHRKQEHYVVGWVIAARLAWLVAGRTSSKQGRGSSFWENVSIVKEGEENES